LSDLTENLHEVCLQFIICSLIQDKRGGGLFYDIWIILVFLIV